MEPNYRRCVACRKVAQKPDFWRIVRVHATQTVALDQGMGRSAYLCPQASCLQAVQRKNRLGRALRANIPEQIYLTLWTRLDNLTQNSVMPQESEISELRSGGNNRDSIE